MPNKPTEAKRKGCLVGCTTIATVCLLAVVGGLALHYWRQGQNAPDVARVEKAVRINFPHFCNQAQDRLLISPSSASSPFPDPFYNTWNVSCSSEVMLFGEAVTIDIADCRIHTPFLRGAGWAEGGVYKSLFVDNQQLAVCP